MEGLHLLENAVATNEEANDSWPTVTAVGNCSNPLDEVDWSQPGLIISLVILGAVNVLVLFGNCLVVLAVFLDSKLRTVTNLFIVSLAMADLSVGLAVLPFSASLEVLDMWIFGEIWCSIWLAVDVWMCTASILNLCAISLDLLGRHSPRVLPFHHDAVPGQSPFGHRLATQFPHLLPSAGRMERPQNQPPSVAPTLRRLVLRIDQRSRLRRLLGPGQLLHPDARHALLLLAHLPGGRRDHQGHQSGFPHN